MDAALRVDRSATIVTLDDRRPTSERRSASVGLINSPPAPSTCVTCTMRS